MKKLLLTTFILFLVSPAFTQNDKNVTTKPEIEKLANDWMVAAMKRDKKALDKIVAKEFILGGTNLDNPEIPRALWMKYTMESLKIDSMNYSKTQVRIIDNTAIMQSTFYWSVAFEDMPVKKDTVNLIDTWLKRDGVWQVVNRLVVDK